MTHLAHEICEKTCQSSESLTVLCFQSLSVLLHCEVTNVRQERQLPPNAKVQRTPPVERKNNFKKQVSLDHRPAVEMYASAFVAFTPLLTSKFFGFKVVIHFPSLRAKLFPVIHNFILYYHVSTR